MYSAATHRFSASTYSKLERERNALREYLLRRNMKRYLPTQGPYGRIYDQPRVSPFPRCLHAKSKQFTNPKGAELDDITWRCEVCTEPIDDKLGMLWVDIVEATKAIRARREWDAMPRANGEPLALTNRPRAVPWHRVHYNCDPIPDAAAYMIEIEKIRSPWQLIEWTSHLMGKAWIDGSDWASCIGRLARSQLSA